MRVIIATDYVHGDSEHGGAEWRDDGSCVWDSNILPGQHGGDRFGAGRIRWRDGDATGRADVWRDWMDVQARPAGGADVCDADVDYGERGLRRIAQERERGDASGDLFYFAEHDVEWADADFAELFDFGGEAIGRCRACGAGLARGAMDEVVTCGKAAAEPLDCKTCGVWLVELLQNLPPF